MAQARTQSNAMLYALITFVALFVVGVVCAVIFYVKSEEYRTQLDSSKSDLQKVASLQEQRDLGKIVGKVNEGKSYLGTMSEQFDKLYSIITGVAPAADLSADAKLNDITMQINKMTEMLGQSASPAVGPEGIALIKLVSDLKTKMDDSQARLNSLTAQYQQLQEQFNADKQEAAFKEQQLVAQVQSYQQNANDIQAKYDELQKQMARSADEQIQAVNKRLEEEQNKLKQKQMELTDTETKLAQANKSLREALSRLEAIRPRPDKEVAAYQPDAGILRVDLQNNMVYLDAGSDDHVYRGLTFAVFDRNAPIPESGEGKAEIEVFQVEPKVSVARIVRGNKKNPIVKEDLVANLIWDSKSSNKFVVLGDFDFDGDGRVDADGSQRIREMIERWGGVVENDVTIETDFVIVGLEPMPMARPDQAEADLDPGLMEKYEASLTAKDTYNATLQRAKELSAPVFNQKRFFYLIGYDALLNTMLGK